MKKGFTLIELLAVIVVLAILALVVTPIVLNIVENAQQGSDERSLEQYAKVVQSTYYQEKMEDPTLTLEDYLSKVDTASGATLTYNGSKVECSERNVVEAVSGTQSIELRNCTVDGRGLYNFINGKASKGKLYKKYENGEVVYFDISNGKICDNYHSDNSKSGYNGTNPTGNQTSCLKFYAFNDSAESSTLNLLLDHNTSSASRDYLTNLKTDTSLWNGTIGPKNYTNLRHTINYSGYKARLITANEIAKITRNTSWDEATATYYYFDSLTNIPNETCTTGNTSGCQYEWLYEDSGYWTSTPTPYKEEWAAGMWIVSKNYSNNSGGVFVQVFYEEGTGGGSRYSGIRPVIIIAKP